MADVLDDLPRLEAMDASGMLGTLNRFPEDCLLAIESANQADLGALADRKITKIVFAGMGGSSIGGRLVMDWLWGESSVPMVASRGYHLPAFVDGETLVFAVSYSGNTEETLRMVGEASDSGASIVAVTSGGKITKLAEEKGYPLILMPEGYRPRAAIPHQFFSLAVALRNLGFAEDSWGEVPEALEAVEAARDEASVAVPAEDNPAKITAYELNGRLPLVYSSPLLEGVASRVGAQLNENSKVPSGSGGFPEAFHNAVMGSEGDSDILTNVALLLLRDPMDDPGLKTKIERFKELFAPKVGEVIELEARGTGKLSRILSMVYMGDWVSAYLGLLNGHDPSTNWSIDELKKV